VDVTVILVALEGNQIHVLDPDVIKRGNRVEDGFNIVVDHEDIGVFRDGEKGIDAPLEKGPFGDENPVGIRGVVLDLDGPGARHDQDEVLEDPFPPGQLVDVVVLDLDLVFEDLAEILSDDVPDIIGTAAFENGVSDNSDGFHGNLLVVILF